MTRSEVAAAAILAASLVALPFIVAAHDHGADWRYDGWCCGDGDCNAVPDSAIESREDGWHVTLRPGDHPMVTAERSWIVPYVGTTIMVNGKPTLVVKVNGGNVRVHLPEDDHYHVCLYPTQTTLRCLYLKRNDV